MVHSLKPCLHKFCQIYLFIYLGLLILCFVIKVANENVLNPFAPGDFAEKRILKLVEWFSGLCRAIKS